MLGRAVMSRNKDTAEMAVFLYALWRLMDSLISSSDALHGNSGSNHTFAVPECMRPCFGQYKPASVPTGRIGNFNVCANNNRPRFNGILSPGFARVPSGKITRVPPFKTRFSTSSANFFMFVLPRARFTPNMPQRQNAQPYIGIHSNSRFIMKNEFGTTRDITAISRMDICFAAIIDLPSRRLFPSGIAGIPFSSVAG